MAVTTTLKNRAKLGNARMSVVEVVIASETYATGGIEITPAKLGMGTLYVVVPAPAAGYIFEYDHDNNKLKAYTPTNVAASGSAGAAGADNTLIRAGVSSIGVSGSGTAAAIRVAGAEKTNGTSLTATVRLIAIGI